MEQLVSAEFLGKSAWLWLGFLGAVGGLLWLDIGVLNRKDHVIGPRESFFQAGFYIAIGLLFGGYVLWDLGRQAAIEYYTGYLVELTLALDNVFVISLILAYFAVPRELQHRVLFWGIVGAVVLRGLMIGLGAALVANFTWVLYAFGAFLLFTGVKMLRAALSRKEVQEDISGNVVLGWLRGRLRLTEGLVGNRFFVRAPHPRTGKLVVFATPLFLTLALVEMADLVFAIDSVPAIFAITQDPYIVYTSNIFAIIGLRALYFALENAVHRFSYLKYALSAVLIFIGLKIFLGDLVFGGKFPAQWSLAITASILAAGVLASIWKSRTAAPATPTNIPKDRPRT